MLREEVENALPHGAALSASAPGGLWRTHDLSHATGTYLRISSSVTVTRLGNKHLDG
jgi:hypothetical protein